MKLDWLSTLIVHGQHLSNYRRRFEQAIPPFWGDTVAAIQDTIDRYNRESIVLLPPVELIGGVNHELSIRYRETSQELGKVWVDLRTTALMWTCYLGNRASGSVTVKFDQGALVAFSSPNVRLRAPGLSTVLLKNILFYNLLEDPLYKAIPDDGG